MSCARTQEFLATHGIETKEVQVAKKEPIVGRAALEVLRGARHLYVTRGKRVVHLDLDRERVSQKELLALIVGPSGKLRAPTVRRGRTVIVGFDEATYRDRLTA